MKETDLAMRINNETYADYLDRLKLLATSLFTWEGLDDIAGVGASRFLELSLYEYGRACFIKDDELGYMALRVNPSDTFNVYMLPTKVQAWSIGYQKNFAFDDVVYIMNNELQIPTARTINQFAYRLYETERTIDVNLIAQKTPILIEGDTKTILTLKNVYMQYSGNTPFIFGSKQFDLSIERSERLKVEYGTANSQLSEQIVVYSDDTKDLTITEKDLSETISKRLEEYYIELNKVTTNLTKSVNYPMVIIGGGSHLNSIDEQIKIRLGRETNTYISSYIGARNNAFLPCISLVEYYVNKHR
jgi:hypothetical protein